MLLLLLFCQEVSKDLVAIMDKWFQTNKTHGLRRKVQLAESLVEAGALPKASFRLPRESFGKAHRIL